MDTIWFKEQIKLKGLTQKDVAEAMGKERSAVSKLITGTNSVEVEHAVVFAELFDQPLNVVLARAHNDKPINRAMGFSENGAPAFDHLEPTRLIRARIVGYVQAGNWSEAHSLPLGEQEIMFVSSKYENKKIFGLKVRGDSMNMIYQEGYNLQCLDIVDMDGELQPGDHVIVNAIRVDDDIETTVKEYHVDEQGKAWLVPKSTNPLYQPYPVPDNGSEHITINGHVIKEIRITAKVVGVHYER